MCVICYKPKGVKMPSQYLLDLMHDANKDGQGFVSTKHSFKSLDYEKFLSHLRQVRTDEECLIHFRWATHGSICRANCHPFKQKGVFFMHNGVLPITAENDMTDSETAFRRYIYPKIDRYGYNSNEMDAAVERTIGGSRFAFMHGGKVVLYGDFIKKNGLYFSNLNFLFRRYNW